MTVSLVQKILQNELKNSSSDLHAGIKEIIKESLNNLGAELKTFLLQQLELAKPAGENLDLLFK